VVVSAGSFVLGDLCAVQGGDEREAASAVDGVRELGARVQGSITGRAVHPGQRAGRCLGP
jgi:hypothetical protein